VDPTIGLMLPCNVTVEAAPGGGSIVRIANPEAMMQMGTAGDNPDLAQVAQQARQKLQRVAQSLEQG
jgi:uncharacterized protein (DUF302 family)